jgi:zinc protease
MRKFFLFLLLLPACTVTASTVYEYKLDNGMKLLVKQDHRAPVVVSQVWYKVGASYEHSGITGVSHVLEHMMFKGTKNFGPGEFSEVIAANGGRENAFTSRDYTAYFQILEKSRLPVSFEMEADRMRNLLLNEKEFKKEVEVVKEERRTRTEDNPRSLTYEKFNATAFTNSPYQNPTIGWMNDLNNMTLNDLANWYRKWYAPNNATLVVVGDVEPDDVYLLAQEHFGGLPIIEIPELKPRMEAVQTGPRRISVRAPAQVPYLIMGYKTPVLNTASEDWEPYALEVLAGILDSGGSARFSRELVREQQIAVDASVSYSMFDRQANLLMISGTPATGRTVEELEQAIHKQIERLKNEKVAAAELERIKAQVIAGDVYEKDSVFYQAMALGVLETVGLGWQKIDEYVERVKSVTAEQIQQVARKYLVENTMTVAVLEPQKISRKKASGQSAAAQH